MRPTKYKCMATRKKSKRSKRSKIDWINLEKEYRVGQLSIRALGSKYEVSEAAIRKKAKKEGWERDLKETFDKALDDAIVQETARESSRESSQSAQCELSDDQIVQAAVDTSLEIVKKHRAHIHKLHDLADKASEHIEAILKEKSFDNYEWMLGTGKESVLAMMQKFASVREKAILLLS